MCTRNPSYFSTILFDRDGTLIVDKHYLADPDGVELIAGCKELITSLRAEGRCLFVVSNQSGIGRGFHSKAETDACNDRMTALLNCPEPPFENILYCPHAPEDECLCRKPATGMWKTIARHRKVDSKHTLMVGDKVDDLLFAHNAGLGAAALVLTGKGEQTAKKLGICLSPQDEFRIFETETRPGFPQIVARDCASLQQALPVFEKILAGRGERHG